ncbi:MAG: rane protein [Paenibacillus sp.]|jgi:predicted lipid-binding transport protein (Tim44 family)|nr:rane protein [Paenibacillus sp.]
MKKWMLVLIACFAVVAFSAPQAVDAKPKSGSFKSGTKTYNPKPADNATKTDPGKSTTTTNPTNGTAAAKPGFFSGGFAKGLLVGGLAGMLFGGLFGGMGFIGQFLGLLVNVMAIFFLIVLIRVVYVYFRDRNKPKKGFQE